MESTNEKIPLLLEAERKNQGYTQDQFARQAGCTQSVISKIESGTQKIDSTFVDLCRIVGLNPIEILNKHRDERVQLKKMDLGDILVWQLREGKFLETNESAEVVAVRRDGFEFKLRTNRNGNLPGWWKSFGFSRSSELSAHLANILVIDDDNALLQLYRDFIPGENYRCIAASTFSDAIGFLRSEPIDLVVSDFDGADGLGSDLLRWMKEEGHPQPVVLVTGNAMLNEEAARAMGASKFFLKPFNFKQLIVSIADLLRKT